MALLAAVADYRVALAHGLADLDNATDPFESALFGHTHSMGFFNRYQVPFQRKVRVTMQCQRGHGAFWVRVGGLENAPITWGNLQVRLTGTIRNSHEYGTGVYVCHVMSWTGRGHLFVWWGSGGAK